MPNSSPPSDPTPPPRLIARRLALGFGAVGLVAVAMCVVLLSIIGDVASLVSGMRHGEDPIRQGLELATAVREQSMHIAHSLIEGDDSHLPRYEHARERVRTRIQQLSPVVEATQRPRLQALGEQTQRMHELFVGTALPAARRGDAVTAREVHREIDALGTSAAEHADALARAVESAMAHSHVLATDATRRGMLAAGVGILLVLVLSVVFTAKLRAAVLEPLDVLTDAARRYGRGEFEGRVGDVGEGELLSLGQAFDRMTGELQARQQRAVQSERMAAIGQLAAGVAHELNNPIGIIRGYLKTMSPEDDAESLRQELSILDEEAAACQRIAEDLLAYARTDELSLEAVRTGTFLEQIVRRFRETTASADRVVEGDVQDVALECDPARIRQVVRNLLLNAEQASGDDGTVTLRAAVDGEDYVIEVQDAGPGVDADDRQRVFEPFFSRRRGGSGLGLSVVQGIVQAHRGRIEVHDAPGGGAIFRVQLPLSQASSARPEAST